MAAAMELRYGPTNGGSTGTRMSRLDAAAPVADSSWMIRYRFESPAALERHLRYGDGGFFVPFPGVPGHSGSRVVVELALPGRDDVALLHGSLGSRSCDGVRLALPSMRAASRWTPGPDAPRRRHRRLPCDFFVEVQPAFAPAWLCRALDLSEGGIRLATGSFETGVAGDAVALTLVPAALDVDSFQLSTRLSWAGPREAGFALRALAPELLRVLQALESRWVSLHELSHSALCPCASAAVRAG